MAIMDAAGNTLKVGDVVAVAIVEGANKPSLVIGPIVAQDHTHGEEYFVVEKPDPRHSSDYAKAPIHESVCVSAVRLHSEGQRGVKPWSFPRAFPLAVE